MYDRFTAGQNFRRHMALAVITAGSTLVGVSAAVAGSCPSDKMQADTRPPVTYAAKGVTDTDHLHRGRLDRRICQQLLGSDRAQSRGSQAGDQRHLALVAEPRK